MPRKRRLRHELDDDGDAPITRRRRPRWRLRLALVLLVIAGLIAAAPTIVGKTPLRNLLLARALPPGTVSLTVSDASFSWFGDQTLGGVTLLDDAGQPAFAAGAVTLQRSLIALASNPQDLGRIVIVRPVAHLEIRPGGSNLESLAARLAEKARQAADSNLARGAGRVQLAEIEIVDGMVLARDAASGQQWRVEQLAAKVRPAAAAATWQAEGTGVVAMGAATAPDAAVAPGAPLDAVAAGSGGRFKFQLHPGDANNQRIDLIADRVPLAALEPWLARAVPGGQIAGHASADLQARWSVAEPGRPRLAAAGKIDAAEIRFTADALRGDLVEFPAASLGVDAQLDGSVLSARQLDARGDWFEARLEGRLDLAEIRTLTLRTLPTRDATLTMRVELSRLLAMLPRTLQLRPGLRIDSGKAEVTAKTVAVDGVRRWTVAAAIDNLLGSNGQRAIRWTQPAEAGVDLADSADGPRLERMLLRTPFASASAEAEAGGFAGEASFNLGDTARELGQFVDLSTWSIKGAGAGKFKFIPTGDQFAAAADLDLADVDVRRGDAPVWNDQKLRISLEADGVRRGLSPQRIDAARLTMRAPGDAVTAELREPIVLGMADQNWSLAVQGEGPLDRWAGRLRPWFAGAPEQLAGQATLAAQLRVRSGYVEVLESKLAVVGFQMQKGDLKIAEPRVEAAGDFRWDAAAAAVDSQDLQVTSSTVAARARNLSVRLAGGSRPSARGDVAFRADLARLAAWGLWTTTPGALEAEGMAVGRLQLTTEGQSATATLAATIEPLRLVRRGLNFTAPDEAREAWNEPRLVLAADAAYDRAADRLQLANVRVQGKTVQLTGGGAIDQFSGAGLVRGDVNISYDAAQLAQLLTAYLGPGVRIEGANQARLAATGPLRTALAPGSAGGPVRGAAMPVAQTQPVGAPAGGYALSRTWQATGEAGWSAANLYGVPVGPAKIVANLRDGRLEFAPLDLAVGQGRLSLHPQVTLDPPPARLQLAPGQVASNIAISAETSDMILKYAAPIIAGATRAEGAFSAQLDGFDMPLGVPAKMRGAGRLTIHRLSVTPGPMIADVVKLVSQIEAVGKGQPLGALGAAPQPLRGVTMTERTIDVQVVDGRVYHRNLEFLIDDVPVRSYGSVGLDESLAIVIEVAIQQKWVGDRRALQNLVGQTIQIPVEGTFDRPKVDERAVANLSRQLLQNAAAGAIGGELNRALDRLFRPK